MSVVPPEKKITKSQIRTVASDNEINPYYLMAFTEVEGSGIGFSDYTGKILIQFEPSYMKRFLNQEHKPINGSWINNGIGNQTVEYEAFESASKIDREAAMKSCSIGMMQVMAAHYDMLGFNTVEAMWNYANISELNQLNLGVLFIKNNASLYRAVKEKNSNLVAYYYNGSGYKELARKYNQIPYDKRIDKAYSKLLTEANIHKTTTTVNIRTGAGTSFDLAAPPLRVNTIVDILDRHDGWARVEVVSTGISGWVSSDYIA